MDTELSDDQGERVIATIREELARRRISRQRLADDAKISISTLEKALSGRRPFTLATIIRLEEALGLRLHGPHFEDSIAMPVSLAAESLGAYSRRAVSSLEGTYVTLRPSFEVEGAIYAYRTEFSWDDRASCLAFQESARIDAAYMQKGFVSLPNKSGHIYLITNNEGQMRLAIFSRQAISGEMYGVLTTLKAGQGSHLTPLACPIVLIPSERFLGATFGAVQEGDEGYKVYREVLARTTAQSYVQFFS
jgi:DNA-binding phage protein